VAHGLTISESAFERHTNKSGFRNVFPALTWVLAVQNWSVNLGYVRNPTQRLQIAWRSSCNRCRAVESPCLKLATHWAVAAKGASWPEASAYLTGLRRKARPDVVRRSERPVLQTGRSFRTALEGEPLACRIRIKCDERQGPARRVAAKITVRQWIEGAWHSHCNRRLTSRCVAAWFLRLGEAPSGKQSLREHGRGSRCVLRGCGGATEKRMSKKTG